MDTKERERYLLSRQGEDGLNAEFVAESVQVVGVARNP